MDGAASTTFSAGPSRVPRLPLADESLEGIRYLTMQALKGRVRQGRLVVDEPTTFPEGTEIELTLVDAGDDLDEAEREALHAALDRAWASAQAGSLRPAGDLIAKLRPRE